MAGHSKWSNIKYKKKINDSKKEKKISKLLDQVNNISNLNSSKDIFLKKIYNKASELNISKSLIKKSILKSSVEIKSNKSLNYSAYIKDGVVLHIICFFDNKNKIASELRYVLSKYNAKLVKNESVLYLFKKTYQIEINLDEKNKVLPILSKYSIKNIEIFDTYFQVIFEYELFEKMKLDLDNLSIKYNYISSIFPHKCIELDCDFKNNINELINLINKLSYVSRVFTNANI